MPESQKVSIEAAVAQVKTAIMLVQSGTPEDAVMMLVTANLNELAKQGK